MKVETILTISYVIKSEGNYANDLAGNTPQFIPASEPARPILERGVRRYKKVLDGLPDNSVLWTKLKLELPGDTRGDKAYDDNYNYYDPEKAAKDTRTAPASYDYTGIGDTKDIYGHYPRKMIGLINRENGIFDDTATSDPIKWTASVDISDYELVITKAELKDLANYAANQSAQNPSLTAEYNDNSTDHRDWSPEKHKEEHQFGNNNDAGVPGPAQQILDRFLKENFEDGNWEEIPYIAGPKRSDRFANNPVLIA